MATYQDARALVLGGAGFLGAHLCHALLDAGAEVIAVDNLVTGTRANLDELQVRPRFQTLAQDLVAGLEVDGPIDFVFNLASPASPRDYGRLPLETLRVGSQGTDHALQFAETKRAVFLQASTSEVYGDPLVHPQSEDYFGNVDPVGPRAVYDESKRYGEALVSAFRRCRGVRTRIARVFNTYGPRMRLDDGRIAPAFIGQALRGEPFTVFGDGRQTRSFCYVDDTVDGFLRLALSDEPGPVNLGNPAEITVLEFVEAVRRATGSRAPIRLQPMPAGDPSQRRPDITRARQRLGWEPRVGLEDGLRRTVAWYRHGRNQARP